MSKVYLTIDADPDRRRVPANDINGNLVASLVIEED